MSARRLPFDSPRCECPACGRLFSNERNFDKHRAGKFTPGGSDRYCRDPAEVGLVPHIVAGGFEVWRAKGNPDFTVSATRDDHKAAGRVVPETGYSPGNALPDDVDVGELV